MNDEWLRDCVEFYVNQHENPHTQEILQFVKVQWQLSDLREINNNNGSLPHNLLEQKFVILSENYILQIEQMYDIATSKYKQLEQIRSIHISEVEQSETEKMEKWKPPKKRMIQLRLTDGVQDVIGIEYSYISQLNDMLLPGYKVMIMGPVKCRKGVLLLEEGKLKGIGGEVDKLLIPNALENVLARALNLKENPDPYNDNETKSKNIKQEEPQIDANFFEDDFEINLENIDEEQLIETEIGHKNIAIPFRTLPTEKNDIIIINEDEETTDVKYDILKRAGKRDSSHINSELFSTKINSSVSTSSSKIEGKALLVGEKRSIPMSPPIAKTLKISKMDRKITEFTKVVNIFEEPKICEFIHDINNEVVTETIFKTVRGRVEILGKLTKSDLSWILEATIADGTGTINVSFSNKVLEDLLGFSVQEFSLKKKLKKNPDIEHKLRMSFRNAEQKIKTLDALLNLELNTNKKPTVIEINNLTQEQKEIIDRRLRNFLLKINN
ncbi:RecQ-mediated genome instability protein 1 [Eufriesea mexicana]|uniref:RecQ-mediated genome instability protein 1 n=1 Tax=Eufriesea mexicana TaxID=516756 RepID=A0A310SLU0_9HYME|nr:RecQ-mediated genome instability protein 1 [Eufriesea mexicana]